MNMGYLMRHDPSRVFGKWQRRWFTLNKAGVFSQARDHTSSPERECNLKVNLQATPAVAVTTQSQPAEVPEGALQDWQQLSDFDILVIWGESQEETLLLRAASIEERDTWVALIQEASGRGPPVARDEDAALVVALNQLHATEASARTPFLASSTINLDEVYELQHVLGQGAVKGVMVRLGRHRASGEVVAIKQVPKTSLATPRQQETMKREVDIMMAVSKTAQPDIALVRAYAVIETSTMVYIVMEYLEGGELFDHIVGGVYDEIKARGVMKQLLHALQHLHSLNVVHRDIKPENILCTQDGTGAKLSDFGLSNTIDAATMSLQSQCGTPVYMAPEMLQKRSYGPGVDVWSLGIVFYIMLSGSMPFYADTPSEFLDLILTANVQFPEHEWAHISLEAKDLIVRMLCVEPIGRITVDQALAHPWMMLV